ncbi:unnamed protein product [Peniophora sp. CBMAI 1063]|nr:unnamed protein product [Peniophora sp. CBMAI 1063]
MDTSAHEEAEIEQPSNIDDLALEKVASEAWKTFTRTRFDPHAGSATPRRGGDAVKQADLELSVLAKVVGYGRRQRNRAVGACSLPAEILAHIFLFAQEGWSPSGVAIDKGGETMVGNKRTTVVRISRRYSPGWMILLHTCSFWRQVALDNPALWTTVHCLAIDPRSISTILSRSKYLPLYLAVDGRSHLLNNAKTPISTRGWLSLSVFRRIASLTITSVPNFRLLEWLKMLSSPIPLLDSLDICGRPPQSQAVIGTTHYARASLPHDIDTPKLRRLKLVDVGFPWTPALFRSTIASLTLRFDTSERRDQAITKSTPTAEQFCQIISSLTSLEDLELHSVFPAIPPEGAQAYTITFPSCFTRLTLRSENESLDACIDLMKHMTFPTRAEVVIKLCALPDGANLQDETLALIPRLFGSVDEACPTELWLSKHAICLQYVDRPQQGVLTGSRPGSNMEWSGFKMAAGGRGLYSEQGHENIEDLPPIISYTPFLPLRTLQTVICTPGAASFVADPTSTWISWFESAKNVENLAIYRERALHMLEALGHRNGDGQFLLFPSLCTLTLHSLSPPPETTCWGDSEEEELRVAVEVALLEMLQVRWENGSPVKKLSCKAHMEISVGEEVWNRLRALTDVEFFP